MEEAFVTCPHCWENISVLVDVSVNGKHQYVEDCEVSVSYTHLTVPTILRV